MANIIKCIVSFIFVITAILAEDYERCRRPDKEEGKCVLIENCPALVKLLANHRLTHEDANYLRTLQCGFEGLNSKICCSLSDDGDLDKKNAISSDLLPNPCGVGGYPRIVGGEVTALDEFPWMALIEYQKPKGRGFYCGGILISNRYVLTAAHCVKGKDLPKTWELTSVRLGEYDTETDQDCAVVQGYKYCSETPIDVPVIEKIAHELYNPNDLNQYHDIALLRLYRIVKFHDFLKPICLPTMSELLNDKFVGQNHTIAGWGKTETRSESSVLLKLEVPVKSNDDCGDVYKDAGVILGKGQICAGGLMGKDSCRGDSGGPLMHNYLGNWVASGIVSYGPNPCGTEGWPGVYTRVSEYLPWIINNLKP